MPLLGLGAAEEWIANEMRRDTNGLQQNDFFGALFDTFLDRRNGFNFYTNPLAARADEWITDEGNPNSDWNPVWSVRTGRFEGGWTAEMAIPFKSLRYVSGEDQTWGIQIRRAIRPKKRVRISHVRPGFDRRHVEHFPRLRRSRSGWPRPASGGEEHRNQAVRNFEPDLGPNSGPGDRQ